MPSIYTPRTLRQIGEFVASELNLFKAGVPTATHNSPGVIQPNGHFLINASGVLSLAPTLSVNVTGTAVNANKLANVRTITLNGDVSGTVGFDGSVNVEISTLLENSGVLTGTYRSVTVDSKGRVTAGTNPTTLAGYGITDSIPTTHLLATNAHPEATTLAPGFMSSTDKIKLDELTTSVVSPGTYKSISVNNTGRIIAGSNPTTLNEYGIVDAVSLNHIGSSGDVHATVTTSVAGFMSSTDKVILNDLNLNITTPGTYRSVTVDAKGRVTVGANPTTLAGYGITDALKGIDHVGLGGSQHALATTSTAGFMSPADKIAVDNLAVASQSSVVSVAGRTGAVVLSSTDIGLNKVANKTPAEILEGLMGLDILSKIGFTPENIVNKNQANGYAGLDANSKILASMIPSIAINDTFVVASQAAMLATGATTGDVAVRTDLPASFILKASPATTLLNWQELLTPLSPVQSVNGMQGVVTITSLPGNAATATKFQTVRTFRVTGDVVAPAINFDGSDNVNLVAELSTTGVTVGTYRSVSVDAKGRVVSGTNPTTLAGYGILDAISSDHIGTGGAAHSLATTSQHGFMSSTDKSYLDSLNTNIVAASTYKSVTVDAKGRVTAGSNPVTLAGYGITDGAPLSHVSSGGSAHSLATVSAAGFMSAADKSTLDSLGNSIVTAGTYKSVTVDAKGRVTAGSNPTTLAGYGITDALNSASPVLTGTPTAPTATSGTNTTQIATTAFVQAAITASISSLNYVSSVAGRTGSVVLTKTDVGLINVDNTTDANKPVSTATQTALNLKLNAANPVFTGVLNGPKIVEKAIAVSATTIDCNTGAVFYKTVTGATTFAFGGISAIGTVTSFILELTNGGLGVITWPNVKWAGGTKPTLTSAGTDLLGFYTYDGGTTWRGMLMVKDSK
jgi:phage-related tail fiber protein